MMSREGEEPPVITLAEFEACALNEPIAAVNQVSMSAISIAYGHASVAASAIRIASSAVNWAQCARCSGCETSAAKPAQKRRG
jgi:hypothetical protein